MHKMRVKRNVSHCYELYKSIDGQFFEFRKADFYYVRRVDPFNPKRFSIKKVDDRFIRFKEDYSKETIFTEKQFKEIFREIKEN